MTQEELFKWVSSGIDMNLMLNPANYLNMLRNPQLRWEPRFELMRDMRAMLGCMVGYCRVSCA